MSRSPIGLRQSVGGAMSFVDCIASWRAFDCSRVRVRGFVSGSRPAATHISFATREETRVNSSPRNAESLGDFVSFIICMRLPSSIPCGCGGVLFLVCRWVPGVLYLMGASLFSHWLSHI